MNMNATFLIYTPNMFMIERYDNHIFVDYFGIIPLNLRI